MSDYLLSSTNINDIIFFYEQMFDDLSYERSLNEMVSINNGNVSELSLIHEGIGAKMGEAFKSLMAAIKKLWDKFIERLDTMVLKDSEYLKKYEAIIYNKKAKGRYTLHPYWKGSNLMFNDDIPKFDMNKMKDDFALPEDEFKKKYFTKYYKDKTDMVEIARSKFRGGEKREFNVDLRMMADYCKESKTIKDNLRKGMQELEDAANEAIDLIEENITEYHLDGDAKYYSYLYETVIHEADKEEEKEPLVKAPEEKAGEDKADGKESEDDTIKKNNETNKKIIDGIRMYIRVCFSFMSAKLAIVEESRKAYMYVIRDHVNSYVGSKNNPEDDTKEEKNSETSEVDKSAKEDKKEEPKKKSRRFKLFGTKKNESLLLINLIDSEKVISEGYYFGVLNEDHLLLKYGVIEEYSINESIIDRFRNFSLSFTNSNGRSLELMDAVDSAKANESKLTKYGEYIKPHMQSVLLVDHYKAHCLNQLSANPDLYYSTLVISDKTKDAPEFILGFSHNTRTKKIFAIDIFMVNKKTRVFNIVRVVEDMGDGIKYPYLESNYSPTYLDITDSRFVAKESAIFDEYDYLMSDDDEDESMDEDMIIKQYDDEDDLLVFMED